ncbi:MAG: site-2 protease family protein [Acidobacteria bacterium]|nr:site-2 protease family protein [Acidobacteriota bacterium]
MSTPEGGNWPAVPPVPGPGPAPGPARAGWRAALPFVLAAITVVTTTLAGGPRYALCLMAFFLAHEMGHYVACRVHGVDSTLPHFIPAPPQFFIGTFGAVIRIRSRIPSRRALFDIGIAGPLAGFALVVPVLLLSAFEARPAQPEDLLGGLIFGDSLMSRAVFAWIRDAAVYGEDFVAGPLFQAAWVGMLATAMNLIPAGQFDGGHIAYALAPRWHKVISLTSAAFLVTLVVFSWILQHQVSVWTAWAVVVLVFGRRHPYVPEPGEHLGAARWALAIVALLVLLLCFMPYPIFQTL